MSRSAPSLAETRAVADGDRALRKSSADAAVASEAGSTARTSPRLAGETGVVDDRENVRVFSGVFASPRRFESDASSPSEPRRGVGFESSIDDDASTASTASKSPLALKSRSFTSSEKTGAAASPESFFSFSSARAFARTTDVFARERFLAFDGRAERDRS